MPESFKTERYEDRPSSKIGLTTYLTQHVPWLLAPTIGAAAGYAVGRLTRIALFQNFGIAIGGFLGTFHWWRGNTKAQVQVDQVTQSVQALREMESGNQYLARENEQLRKQIKFSEREAAPTTSHAEQAAESKDVAKEAQR